MREIAEEKRKVKEDELPVRPLNEQIPDPKLGKPKENKNALNILPHDNLRSVTASGEEGFIKNTYGTNSIAKAQYERDQREQVMRVKLRKIYQNQVDKYKGKPAVQKKVKTHLNKLILENQADVFMLEQLMEQEIPP